MGKVVCIVSRKGGVGKTTLTLGLADTLVGQIELPYQKDRPLVVVVDLDPQGSLTSTLLFDARVVDAGVAAARWNEAQTKRRTLACAVEDLMRQPTQPSAADHYLTHGVGPIGFSYSLLATEERVWDVERDCLLQQRETELKQAVRQLIDHLSQTYKYVLIDCPPGQTVLAEAAIRRADLLICPIAPDLLSYWGLESFNRYLTGLFPVGEKRPPARFVLTKYKANPASYDPQEQILERVNEFAAQKKFVTLLREAGAGAELGKEITLPYDPRLAVRFRGPLRRSVEWLWSKIYTPPTQKGLARLALAVKRELGNG